MSDVIALVRFPDGDLRAAYFFGDPEVVVPILVPIEDAEQLLEAGLDPLLERMGDLDLDGPEPPDTVAVEVWVAYGTAIWWAGRASKAAALLVEGDGSEVRELHRGTPEWVPPDWRVDDDPGDGAEFERVNSGMDDWREFGDPSGDITAEDVEGLLGMLGGDPPTDA